MGRGRGPAGSDALQGRGARSSPATPGLRSPAASRGRSPSARPGTLPLPKCRLQGCAVRSDWWSQQHLLKPRRERNEPAMNDALHRPGHRGRHRVSAASAAISQPTERLLWAAPQCPLRDVSFFSWEPVFCPVRLLAFY